MVRFLFRGLFFFFLLVCSVAVFSTGVFSAVHPLYSGFSSASNGFVFNNASGLVSVADTAVYKTGYYSVNGSAWQSFALSGVSYNGNANWLRGLSLYTLPSMGVGEHYVIVYSCTYNAGNVSWYCNDNKWQLVVVNNSVSGGLNGSVLNCSDANARVCTISNGVGIQTMTCNASTGIYGAPYSSCVLTGCNSGYVPSGNSCVEQSSGSCNAGEYLFNGVCLLNVSGNTYFVATTGNDSNPGTFTQPFYSWQKAFETADAGDIVYFRGGVWTPTQAAYGNNILNINPRGGIGNSGTAERPIRYFNYPGENPVLDCSLINPLGNFNTGLEIYRAHFLYFRGLTIRNVRQPRAGVEAFGMVVSE